MWILILAGGGLMILLIGPISFRDYLDIDPLINSGAKIILALFLIFIWVLILTKVKNWIFKAQIKF
jgi:ABC-type uncharacterized transport system permease subunit